MQVPVPALSSSAARMYTVRCSGLQDMPLTRSSVVVLRVPYARLLEIFRRLSPRSRIDEIISLSSEVPTTASSPVDNADNDEIISLSSEVPTTALSPVDNAASSRGKLVRLYPRTIEGLANLEADIAQHGSMAALSRHLACSPSTLSRHRGSIRSTLRKIV